jgi:hypothetical protein
MLITLNFNLCMYICMQMYQDANTSVEGGQHEIDENEDGMVGGMSTAGPSTPGPTTTGPVQVKLGKLGKHNNYYLS